MPRRDPQPGGVLERTNRRGAKERPLLGDPLLALRAADPIENRCDLFPSEDADDLIDVRHFFEQPIALALGQTAGDDDGADPALPLQFEHLSDDGQRFLPGRLDETAGIDDDDIRAVRVRRQRETILRELAEHPLAVHCVFGAAEADEG